MDLAGHQFEAHVMKRAYARKAFAELVDGNEWIHVRFCRRLTMSPVLVSGLSRRLLKRPCLRLPLRPSFTARKDPAVLSRTGATRQPPARDVRALLSRPRRR